MRMNFQPILCIPRYVLGPPGLSTYIVLRQDPASSKDQWITRRGTLIGRNVLGEHKASLAAYKLADMHHRCAFGRGVIAGPLNAAEPVELFIRHSGKNWREAREFIHDFRGMRIVHWV